MKELLDTEEAAAYLRLSPKTLVKNRCIGGSPPFFKAGRRVIYDRADLDRWLDERRRTSTSDVGSASDA